MTLPQAPTPPRPLPTGPLAAIPTFFKVDTEDVDHDSIGAHAIRLVKSGIVGIVTIGSNGEAPHLSHDERIAVTETTRKALDEAGFGQIPIIMGASDASVRGTLSLIRGAAKAGADYVLVLPPSYFRGAMTGSVISDFYGRVADSSPLPLLVYSFPAVAAGIEMDSDLITIISRHPNVVGTKFTCGDTGKLARVARAMDAMTPHATNSGYVCYGGLADFGLMALVAGGSGFIAGGANIFPKTCARLCEAFKLGGLPKAMEFQRLLSAGDWPHTAAGIAGTKGVLERFNGYGGVPRLPLQPLNASQLNSIINLTMEVIKVEDNLEPPQHS
ncbi:uncharacterized protein Z520_07180 [Fonsecaea multimorphosa CBS 102226]|uniref:4-hydroxy-2-oxoglutarate aldolase, mitochondrial n=1 Tax=Fonsecaea multimorphosa CBS 102226 TaxID=1442371 RepID=A0A0D2IJ47_9EURO|nr:uncharacterized protein Z520_07180 [Fonsecaea multimorphosa CBS 102226]KIX97066.1 hypothetical protein Z520_07180 [Fonsecaea multimorphosa CBS 102226]OAL22842.1 hypothetical protein AYO22_06750 [Fonsecaea multimorphosa]